MFLRTNKKNALIAAAVLVLSPFLSQELLKNWNYSRIGYRVTSSGLATALVAPAIDLINIRAPQITQTNISPYLCSKPVLTFSDGITAVAKKMTEERKTSIDIQNENLKFFYKSFFTYPKEKMILFWHNLHRDIFMLGLNPFNTVQEWIDPKCEKIPHISSILKEKSFNVLNLNYLINTIMLNLFRIISLIISFIALSKLVLIIKSKNWDKAQVVILGLAIHSIAWICLHALGHLELRYVLSSIILWVIVALSPAQKIEQKSLPCVV